MGLHGYLTLIITGNPLVIFILIIPSESDKIKVAFEITENERNLSGPNKNLEENEKMLFL